MQQNKIDLPMLMEGNDKYYRVTINIMVYPRLLDNCTISESSNIAHDKALVCHRECMLLGINKDMQMECDYTQDGFQRMIKALRIYIRCDLGIVKEKGISLVLQKLNIIYWCMGCPCTFFYCLGKYKNFEF